MLKLGKNIKSTLKNVLINESEALLRAVDRIDDRFEAAIEAIYDMKGRLVVSGIGKSAIVAQKIVATFNSTGTPALFMHAADAIHGDLGMIRRDDLVMLISKSGDSPEIKVLIPLIKNLDIKLIALTSNVSSFLARQADYLLDATIKEEACTHNLAPTTSTTLHMAIGDALAVTLLEAREFSSSDFAKLHPGGHLGKRLYLRVGDLTDLHELPVVAHDASLKEVIVEISAKRLGATCVLDTGKLTGIVTDGDLRRMLEKNSNFEHIKASDIMTQAPKTIRREAFAAEALKVMKQYQITQLVVLNDKDEPTGIIHMHDLIREGII